MSDENTLVSTAVSVSVVSEYIAQQSVEAEHQFVFSYTITITNNSAETVQLLSRYWLIKANESFTYTSGCLLKSPLGNMQGHYQMQTKSAKLIQVEIPVFRLAKPNILN